MIDLIDHIIFLFQNPLLLIQQLGYIGLIIVIFLETGCLLGMFLPGDSLLISAGLLASSGYLSMLNIAIYLPIAAIIGDACGFYIGHSLGMLLYKREDSVFFRRKHLILANDFYKKHGAKAIILSRFVPIIRTLVPTLAGAAGMSYFKFSLCNIIGAIAWVYSLSFLGYYLGEIFGAKIQHYLHWFILAIMLISISPYLLKQIKKKL